MMENTEIIKALRWCGSEDERHEMCVDESYRCPMWNEDRITDDCKAELMRAAADALEAADEKITDCVAAIDALDDSNDAYIKENERLKKRIEELEAQMPKEGECKKLLRSQWINYYECSICGNRFDDAVNYCPHCGARMRGEKQC
jgi:hypothetical protein